MTPQQFQDARRRLKLSVTEMARALGISDRRAIRRYEDGTRDISDVVALLTEAMLAGYAPPEDGRSPTYRLVQVVIDGWRPSERTPP